jgi:uncharacterized protein (TIGR03118 family)
MRNWFRNLLRFGTAPVARQLPSRCLALESLEDRSLLSAGYLQTNLVSDTPGMAAVTDNNLVNPWGLSYAPTGEWWVSDNVSGTSTLYLASGTPESLVVTIPPAPGSTPGSPTGTVFNSAGSGFSITEGGKTGNVAFFFDSTDGTISAWAPSVNGTQAFTLYQNVPQGGPAPGPIYTGLALDMDSIGRNLLYAANNLNGTIDVYQSAGPGAGITPTTVPGGFADPNIPKSYTPFNIQNIGGLLYVTYEELNAQKTSDIAGVGLGLVDVFNSDGVLQQRLISHGVLNEPWGVAVAPANFGAFSNDLLIGNDGDGLIHAFNPHTGQFVGTMTDGQGKPIVINELWALKFGNGGQAGPTNELFFTAGIPNGDTEHGLFGTLQANPPVPTGAGLNGALLSHLSSPAPQSFSTVPANGDVNPYGVAFVPNSAVGGKLVAGGILVSNFNNAATAQNPSGQQGLGTTIVEIGPNGQSSVFYSSPTTAAGLSTALAVLNNGFVIVGNLPTTDGTSNTVGQGSLQILDKNGNLVKTLSDANKLDGPWDMAIGFQTASVAELFVSNVLSGTVTRVILSFNKSGVADTLTQIASGYTHTADPNALEIGPTGLAYSAATDTLYVASTGDNEVFGIVHASTTTDKGKGKVIYQDTTHLHGPLGLVIAPNGDLIVANGDAENTNASQLNELVEFTPAGHFVTQFQLDSGAGGADFGIAVSTANGETRFAAVDDSTNTLDVWTFG